MKNLFYACLLLCWACAKPVDFEADKAALTKLIDDETKYAASGDSLNWVKCWINTSEAQFIIASANGLQQFNGWNNIRDGLKGGEPFSIKLERNNYNFAIDHEVAFVSFDQQDNWGGIEGRRTKESRALRKVDGQWKIVNAIVIAVSSYDIDANSFHIAKEKITLDPITSLSNQTGGGMYVGYLEVPAGTDFTPLFAGLPQDMCPSPHWGYVLDGSIRIKYGDGREEMVNKGEVFYLPAPHTGVVEKDLKFIDFSPLDEFNQLKAHIAKSKTSSN